MLKYQTIYNRFGISLEVEKVHKAFCGFIVSEFSECLWPLRRLNACSEEIQGKIDKISSKCYRKICYATCIDKSKYEDDFYGTAIYKLITSVFQYNSGRDLGEYYVSLQIVIDIIFEYNLMREELLEFTNKVNQYFFDFPMLGVQIKLYKTKSPQIFPSISKAVNEQIGAMLDLLEEKGFENTLKLFEDGMKEFLSAKTGLKLKNVVDDMRGTCDEIIKDLYKNQNKGFRSIFKEGECQKFGLSSKSKKIYEEFMNRMDDIKHGKEKEYTRTDILMIIGMTTTFIQFVVGNYNTKH